MTYNALNAARIRIKALLDTARFTHSRRLSNGMKENARISEAQVHAYGLALEIINQEIANVNMLKEPEALL